MEHIINTPIDSGSGDTLTVAFGKVNDNFDNIETNYPTNTDLTNELSNYMEIGDEVSISQVTGLETALTNKVDVSSYNNDLLVISNDIIDINLQINELNTEIDNLSFPDIYVTGGTYSAGTAVFTNNTGVTFSVTGFTTGFTPGIDVFVTGGTYSSGTTIFTNNTGGTFSVTGYTTGDTGSGGYWYAENSTPPATSPIASGSDSIAMGRGTEALSADMFVYGTNAGQNATNAYDSNFFGQNAGAYATNANNSNFMGNNAGQNASGAIGSNFLGQNAGRNAFNTQYGNFIGYNAGDGASGSTASTFIGLLAGRYATNAPQSIFIGSSAGEEATYASNAQFIGSEAGFQATNAQNSVFIGRNTGTGAINSSWSNFIGSEAGYGQENASYSTLMGYAVGSSMGNDNELGSNNIIIGTNISLPSGSTNSVNIGGILFGSNTNSFDINNPTPPSIEPSINGRIGIGIVNPQATLHISGDTIIDGTISATTYLNFPDLSGSYLPLSGGTMDDNASISFNNTSQLREGTYDFGGQGGISQICSVGYENNWQSGFNHIFDNNGFIRESRYCFNVIPDNTFDDTLRFKVGSRWVLDNGDIYICSDATTGAAVWTYYNSDIYVTGGTYSDGTTTFTNNTGGTFNVDGYYTGFTPGVDVFVTGGTYSSGNAIFTNNTGGTFSVSGFAVGGGGGQTFYLNLSQSQNGNRLLSSTASTASEQTSGVTINAGATGSIASFQSQPLNITLIPGGVWSFYLHSYKQNNNAGFQIFVEVYKRTSGGTQTLLFTTDPAPVTTNSPNPSMQLTDGYFSGTTLNVSDSIIAVVRATNTGNQSHTITLFTEGTNHYSYAVSTIPTQQGLTCDTLSGCSVIQTIETNLSNKFDKSGGTITGGLTANTISATTYQNLPTDVFVTGGTYNSGNLTFTNITGGTFNVTGLYTGFTPGIDVFVTGGTFNAGTTTFTNNTGGTFNVTGYSTGGGTFTGGTVTGPTTFTNGLTANTISATTYQNLPTDVFVTGGTYNSGTGVANFVNNTGGTFNVTGFNTGGGGGGLTLTQVTGLTLSATSWTLVSGFYEYDLSDGNITSTSVVNVIPDNASTFIVNNVGILPRTDSSTGSVKIYSTYYPYSDITITINILK
jgi:hypothetical protein